MINREIIQISEIISPAKAGRTEPFLCRGEDNNLYYVKGAHTGRRGQVSEWIGSSLATVFGLPAAKCVIVEISEELINISPLEWQKIGHGLAFGSLAVPGVMEINISHISSVTKKIQQDILIFDWWIENADRTLTEHGGNPNLLWDVHNKEIVVIDHNLAFDRDFNNNDFFDTHIFREQINSIYGDWILRKQYEERFLRCLEFFDSIWDQMPDEWLWIGDGLPLGVDQNMILDQLYKCKTEFLWRVAK